MARNILCCIFSDNNVLRALALAEIMNRIRGGKAPEGLLPIFKKSLAHHIKENRYIYQKEIKEEIAHIARIKELKAQMVALVISGAVAVFIGISNFASNYVYDRVVLGDDQD